ncbi:MAG: hypothetical protein QOG10_5241 [Kribbellaceae bacterium]|nr:hypothetical protein [Kribbellaceae bacterium]
MNLTTPPPVKDLDPGRADQLRSNLVTMARDSQREARRPTWVPMLAAACGIAVITTGVVVLAQSGGDSSDQPAAPTPSSSPSSSPTSAPSPSEVQKVPASKSARVSLDLGPASIADARSAAQKCLTQKGAHSGEPNPATPNEADTATVHQARWLKTVPGPGHRASPEQSRLLMQTFSTAKGVWFQCLGPEMMRAFDPARAGTSREVAMSLNPADPVNGQRLFASVPWGGSTLLWVDYSFATMPNVARVELRIRWTGGASPWYGVSVTDGAGYVAASQPGAVYQRGEMEVDIRAFDAAGKQVFTDVDSG